MVEAGNTATAWKNLLLPPQERHPLTVHEVGDIVRRMGRSAPKPSEFARTSDTESDQLSRSPAMKGGGVFHFWVFAPDHAPYDGGKPYTSRFLRWKHPHEPVRYLAVRAHPDMPYEDVIGGVIRLFPSYAEYATMDHDKRWRSTDDSLADGH